MEGNSAPSPPHRPRSRRRRLTVSVGLALTGMTVATSAAFGGLDRLADNVRDHVYCKVIRDCVYDEPATKIVRGPDGRTDDATPSFSFTSDERRVTYRCRVDAKPFRQCESPHTTDRLDDGRHSFEVYAVDKDGLVDRSPASREFTVDTEDPECSKIRGPKRTRDRTPVFRVRSDEAGSKFEYRLDRRGKYRRSGPKVKPKDLRKGNHVLEVRSVDRAGNVDRSPAKHRFRVVGKRRH
jgi:hypothetical protein